MIPVKPDWDQIQQTLPVGLSEQALHAEWRRICRTWLTDMAATLDGDYTLFESANFLLLSCEEQKYLRTFTRFLESKLKAILRTLPGIASDQGYGPHAVIIFNAVAAYDDYCDLFNHQDQETTPSSGMYINDGYGHLVFATQDMDTAEAIACHELTHACLSHLPLPLWLNEGIAMMMETALGVAAANIIDHSYLARHRQFWDQSNIQDFLAGSSFTTFGPAQELSYSLAAILVSNLAGDFVVFRDFVLAAAADDAGAQAAQQHLGITLAELIGGILNA